MGYQIDKTGTIIINGFEKGIAPSPYKGFGNLQNVNLSTETGEVMASYGRAQQTQTNSTSTGTITATGSGVITATIDGGTIVAGMWITIGTSTISSISNSTDYFVKSQTGANTITLSSYFNSANITPGNTGTATFTIKANFGLAVASATERYTDSSGFFQFRYYILDNQGYVWVKDTGLTAYNWFLPDTQIVSNPNDPANVNALVVGGGGGGGGSAGGVGGGGGAGGYVSNTSFLVAPGEYTITVGAGGHGYDGGSGSNAYPGGDSIFSTITATGGGGGGVTGTSGLGGGSGAGGGGGSGSTSGGVGSQGSNGGAGVQTGGSGFGAAGGGGGAGAVGGAGVSTTGGNGGNGTANSISGSSVTYAGGGGGSARLNSGGGGTAGTGGTGGGGNGAINSSNASNGTANRGGGGGGASQGLGGNGGSGIVIISYTTGTFVNATGGTMTTSGGNTIHTFTSSGTFNIPTRQTITNPIGGIAVLNGWLMVYGLGKISAKPTTNLGDTTSNNTTFKELSFVTSGTAGSNSLPTSPNPHYMFVGHQNTLYYTDGRYIGSIFPNSEANPDNESGVNIQSFVQFTASSTTGTPVTVITGSLPTTVTSASRIPVSFFSSPGGATATTTPYGVIKWLLYASNNTFTVFDNATGGSALDISSGASGTQYFNTFYPVLGSGSDTSAQDNITYIPQHLNLPVFETAQSIAELGGQLIIGTKLNTLYSWNQVDPLAASIIPLSENNTTFMLTVNNMVYVFAGNKGNVYITNGSTASLVISVPDYCAGIAGTPSTYVEPYFTWGGAMYLRGRVYFSILDQTSTKEGNCGGIWSFVPTQNAYIGQDTGLALRLENQSSYGTYDGVSPVLIASQSQNASSPQYWSAWTSNTNAPAYGIDFTDTHPNGISIIETDLIPTGTILEKKTFEQVEYKLSTPLVDGESIAIAYRQNSTDDYIDMGTVQVESTTALSGYFNVPFEKGQWLQLKMTLNPLETTATSFCRLSEVRVR